MKRPNEKYPVCRVQAGFFFFFLIYVLRVYTASLFSCTPSASRAGMNVPQNGFDGKKSNACKFPSPFCAVLRHVRTIRHAKSVRFAGLSAQKFKILILHRIFYPISIDKVFVLCYNFPMFCIGSRDACPRAVVPAPDTTACNRPKLF